MKRFPIMKHTGLDERDIPCPSSIPWAVIAPFERAAQNNHSQSLETLASRGGLSPVEAMYVLKNIPYDFKTTAGYEEAIAFLEAKVETSLEVRIAALGVELAEYKRLYEFRGEVIKRPCIHCGNKPKEIRAC